MNLRLLISTFLFLALLPLVSLAEDRTVILTWNNPPENTGAREVAYFAYGWTRNTTGPPYTVGSVSADKRGATLPFANLNPGDSLHFAVAACNSNAECSPWSAEITHIVVADPPPGEGTSTQPKAPIQIILIVQ